jgi:hypothetical protein
VPAERRGVRVCRRVPPHRAALCLYRMNVRSDVGSSGQVLRIMLLPRRMAELRSTDAPHGWIDAAMTPTAPQVCDFIRHRYERWFDVRLHSPPT